jgi:RNase P protein component
MDKKNVRFLASCGSPEMIESFSANNESRIKPTVIHDYNKIMPGVDMSDQKSHGRKVARNRIKRWYKKLLHHFIDVSLINAFVIIHKYIPNMQKLSHADFRSDLVLQILAKHPLNNENNAENQVPNPIFRLRKHTEGIEHGKSRECHLCRKNKIRKMTSYFCQQCNVALCVIGCYHRYHTQVVLE